MKKIANILMSRTFIVFTLVGIQLLIVYLLVYELSFFWWANSIFLAIALILVFYITGKEQKPEYKLGWIILLLILPLLGMLMYFFFSQRKLNKDEIKWEAQVREETKHLLAPIVEEDVQTISKSALRQSEYIKNTSTYPLYSHTKTTYYSMGEDFYKDLLLELKKAKKYIFMEYFIIENGKMWDSILEILEQKVSLGVEVRLMYDDMGCASTLPHKYYLQMREKGIKCVVFNPIKPVLNSMFNNRDHRKITVIDGHTGFCGGVNLADEYINETVRFGVWKDTAVRLQGNAVFALLVMFLRCWEFVEKKKIDYSVYEADMNAHKFEKDGYVQPFTDSPADDIYISQNVILSLINNAKRYIYITTPYLVVGNEIVTALITAANSGVDVRILIPNIPDKKGVYLLTKAYASTLIKGGVKVFKYKPGFLHAKTVVCDDKFAIVGSINMDFRSLYLNFECGVWMYKTACIKDIKADLTAICEQGVEYTKEEVDNTPLKTRIAQNALRLFGPMM